MSFKIENKFLGVEYQEKHLAVVTLINEFKGYFLVVQDTAWVADGKYRFLSTVVLSNNTETYLKATLSMFGNNPRDDYQYIEVCKLEKVKRVEKVSYSYE